MGIDMSLCSHCGHNQMDKRDGGRAAACKRCKKETWFTAGTFLHGVKLPQQLFAALWVYSRGVRFNSRMYSMVAGIAYDTAWTTVKKVNLLMDGYLEELIPAVPSELFFSVIFRRTRLTPAKKHPNEEDEHGDNTKPKAKYESTSGSGVDNFPGDASSHDFGEGLAETERKVYQAISTDSLHFDHLCQSTGVSARDMAAVLTFLELSELIERLPGEFYRRRRLTNQKFVHQRATGDAILAAGAAMEFISETFHGVSKKYLQLYLAAHWCWLDRKRWTIEALLKECLRQGKITKGRIRAYVSPHIVRVYPGRSPPLLQAASAG
jgi:hypothetical protein